MRRLKDNYSVIASTLALVIALTGTTAMASGLISGKQIKNGSITAKDIKKRTVNAKLLRKNSVTAQSLKTNAVTSKALKAGAVDSEAIKTDAVTSSTIAPDAVGTQEIGTGAVTSAQIGNGDIKSADIGDGEVQPEDITEPAPQQFVIGSATGQVDEQFGKVTDVGTYTKQDPTSILSVTWTGTALAPRQSCIFQLRVDGQQAPEGAGLVFANLSGIVNVSSTALFSGLAAGAHTVEVWARAITGGLPVTDPCVIGPEGAGIPQTFVVSEELT
jgi:hypothetical protein